MLITRISMATRIPHTREVNVTDAQISLIESGELVQRVCPHLSADDREFLISGIIPEEWDVLFSDEE